ncbi:espin-like protein [Hippocampus comes]|uniref:espin-like protein n=1 Tax=Hippocampus comes TaxID=109280 RepID=UPI00094E3AF2|nr:PREDICTED: espin-like protein [Hippocampus comes]
MTEGDLNRIEKQIENLQVMHKVSEVEKELEELERELHQLLPVSAALTQGHFSVHPKQVHGQAEDLPAWCSKISTLLKSMAILLATLGGKEIDILELVSPGGSQKGTKNAAATHPDPAAVFIGRSQSFSTKEEVEKEMRQFGVSVRNLKANYEIPLQSANGKETRVYKRQSSLPVVSTSQNHPETVCQDDAGSPVDWPQSRTNRSLPSKEESVLKLVEEPVIGASYATTEIQAQTKIEEFNQVLSASADPFLNQHHHQTRSLEVQTDLSYVQECIETRKERIVFLFLEHWRKYTISESVRRGNHLDLSWENSEDDKLLLFMKSKQVVGKLIGHWRTIMSQVPSRQIRRLSRAQMIYWPEHFLPHINGSPVSYESLTLDLFMLGYFQLLEMNLSRDERKFRHLLCYEMFDRLGRHRWEIIKQFHKEVLGQVERGTRDWADGFEDVKLKYFGDADDEGGVMSASLHSASPEVAYIPTEESHPPPPCHPPPPPPPNARPTPTCAPRLDPRFASPDAAPDGALDTGRCASIKNLERLQETAGSHEVAAVEGAAVKTTAEPVHKTPSREKRDSIQVIYELKEFSNEEIIRYIDRSFAFWKEKEAELFAI